MTTLLADQSSRLRQRVLDGHRLTPSRAKQMGGNVINVVFGVVQIVCKALVQLIKVTGTSQMTRVQAIQQ